MSHVARDHQKAKITSLGIHKFNPLTEMEERRKPLLDFVREPCTILYGCSLAPFASGR